MITKLQRMVDELEYLGKKNPDMSFLKRVLLVAQRNGISIMAGLKTGVKDED